MHAAFLTSSDFKIIFKGTDTTQKELCTDYSVTDALALVTPDRVEGTAAANLVLAYIAAFYSHFEEKGEEHHIYPPFYSIQFQSPPALYSMLDIYPEDKNLVIDSSAESLIETINDKQIKILILPNSMASFIEPCRKTTAEQLYLYPDVSELNEPNLTIETDNAEIISWVRTIFETEAIKDEQFVQQLYTQWQKQIVNRTKLVQRFRKLELHNS